jgi:2-succinyl-6-hydroxy-2,4-cyclohexadiene-1-carboxylate synthase
MPKIRVDDVHYYYRRRGIGPPLVLLHGFSGSSISWATLTDTLAKRMDIIAIDLLGHGHTGSPQSADRYAIEYAAQDITAIVDYLGFDRFSLLGYSMGGRLALYLAHRFPELIKVLILESASPGIADAAERKLRRQQDYALAASIERDGVSTFVDRWEQLPLFASQSSVSRQRKTELREQRLQNNALGLANSLRGMGTGSQPSLWSSLPAVTIPTLLLCGDLDKKYVRIGRQIAAISNSELEVFGHAGHNIHFERPSEFSAVVSSFLERLT